MCYPTLRAEGLSMEDGVPVFHFEPIGSSQYDNDPDCISNNTPLGSFEIDISKRKLGDPNSILRIPFRAINWNASLLLYKLRFAQYGHPILAVSDPASLLVSVIYGYTFGYAQIKHEAITHYYVTVGPLLGLTSATINSATVKNPALLTQDQNNPALSYGLGAIFGRNNFGVTVACGFDVSLGDNSGMWIYQNKLWTAIGISTGLGMF